MRAPPALLRGALAAAAGTAARRPRALLPLAKALSTSAAGGQPSSPSLDLTPEQVRRIGERSKQLHEEHLRLKTEVPATSLDPARANEPVDADEVRRKRLLYRSKQRGWLEVDLLLGSWAAEHVPTLSTAELDEYERVLNQETIDIFNIVNGSMQPPPELAGSAVLKRLQDYAASSPFGKASTLTYEEVKDRTNLI